MIQARGSPCSRRRTHASNVAEPSAAATSSAASSRRHAARGFQAFGDHGPLAHPGAPATGQHTSVLVALR